MPTAKKPSAPIKKAAPVKKAAPAPVVQPVEVHEAVMDLPQEPVAPVIPLHPDGMVVIPLFDGPRASTPPANNDPKIGMARLLRLRQQGR